MSISLDPASLRVALAEIHRSIDRSDRAFDRTVDSDTDSDDEVLAAWHIELVFLRLLSLTEALGLAEYRAIVAEDLAAARSESPPFTKSGVGPDGPYAKWAERQRQLVLALETLTPAVTATTITRPLVEILRACLYPITDTKLFGAPPRNEAEVHTRIEGVLRCLFPDLKHKPTITKPIKNFEPDTGLPSARTLIEYKFINNDADAARVSDEVLADTRGYTSREYDSFVYVIYETIRVRPESVWVAHLRECDVSPSASIIVLSGVPKI